MLTELLESSPRRRRRHYSILVSIVGHAAALSGAVVAAHPLVEPRERERVITWHPPPPPPPTCTQCAPRSPTGPSGEAHGSLPTLPHETLVVFTVDVPDNVSVDDSAVAISQDEWRRETSAERGGAPESGLERTMVDREVIAHSTNPAPRYPADLRAAHIEGKVIARFVVDTSGRVIMESVTIDASTHRAFSTAVVEALRHARFTPAELRGRKVRQLVSQPFVFVLRDAR